MRHGSASCRILASIVLVVGWYVASSASSWTRDVAAFSAGAWSTDTANVTATDLLVFACAAVLSIAVASLVGRVSSRQAGGLIFVFWSVPMLLGYGLGAFFVGWGPGGSMPSSAAVNYILGAPVFAGLATFVLNRTYAFLKGTSTKGIDAGERPLAWFFYGPLLRTPQGLACMALGAASLLAGVVYVASPSDSPLLAFRFSLFLWPVVPAAAFLALGYRNGFRSSFPHAAVIALLGACPFLLPFVRFA